MARTPNRDVSIQRQIWGMFCADEWVCKTTIHSLWVHNPWTNINQGPKEWPKVGPMYLNIWKITGIHRFPLQNSAPYHVRPDLAGEREYGHLVRISPSPSKLGLAQCGDRGLGRVTWSRYPSPDPQTLWTEGHTYLKTSPSLVLRTWSVITRALQQYCT